MQILLFPLDYSTRKSGANIMRIYCYFLLDYSPGKEELVLIEISFFSGGLFYLIPMHIVFIFCWTTLPADVSSDSATFC